MLHPAVDIAPSLKVAVLIPLYNHARYIGAAVASLRAQSRPPDRVIIIDDGSTDGSLNALIAAGDGPAPRSSLAVALAGKGSPAATGDRIETRTEVLIQTNAGAQATLNRAIAMAEDCDYVAILNSDDCYHPRRLERCLAFLEEHPQIDLVCTRLRLIDEDGETLPADTPRARWFSAAWSYSTGFDGVNPPDLAEWLGLANFAGSSSNFFARTPYLRAHPFQAYRFAYEYHTLVVAALDHKLGVLDAELLDHRIHPARDHATEPERLIREMLRINLDLARALAGRLVVEPALRAAFTRYQRALWSNVSAVRADLFNFLLCEALAMLPGGVADQLIDQLDRERYPEIAEFPNRAIIKTQGDAASAPGLTGGLADRFYQLRAQLSGVRADARPWMEYRQLQTALLDSRWYALGRLLGRARTITQAGGRTAPEKLTALRERIAASRWLRLGHRLGVRSATRLLALCRSSAQVD